MRRDDPPVGDDRGASVSADEDEDRVRVAPPDDQTPTLGTPVPGTHLPKGGEDPTDLGLSAPERQLPKVEPTPPDPLDSAPTVHRRGQLPDVIRVADLGGLQVWGETQAGNAGFLGGHPQKRNLRHCLDLSLASINQG